MSYLAHVPVDIHLRFFLPTFPVLRELSGYISFGNAMFVAEHSLDYKRSPWGTNPATSLVSLEKELLILVRALGAAFFDKLFTW